MYQSLNLLLTIIVCGSKNKKISRNKLRKIYKSLGDQIGLGMFLVLWKYNLHE